VKSLDSFEEIPKKNNKHSEEIKIYNRTRLKTQRNCNKNFNIKTTVTGAEINHSVKDNPHTQSWIQNQFPPY
jgi:hypothetical protein